MWYARFSTRRVDALSYTLCRRDGRDSAALSLGAPLCEIETIRDALVCAFRLYSYVGNIPPDARSMSSGRYPCYNIPQKQKPLLLSPYCGCFRAKGRVKFSPGKNGTAVPRGAPVDISVVRRGAFNPKTLRAAPCPCGALAQTPGRSGVPRPPVRGFFAPKAAPRPFLGGQFGETPRGPHVAFGALPPAFLPAAFIPFSNVFRGPRGTPGVCFLPGGPGHLGPEHTGGPPSFSRPKPGPPPGGQKILERIQGKTRIFDPWPP